MRVYTSGQIGSGAIRGVAPSGFYGIVEEMLCDYPSRGAIRCYVAEVYRIAAAVLAVVGDAPTNHLHGDSRLGGGKSGGGKPTETGWCPSRNCDDPALQLIESLFERGPDGGFVRLRCFYLAHDWQRLSDEELWVVTRRMVEGELSTDVESIPASIPSGSVASKSVFATRVDDCLSLKNRLAVDFEAFG